MAFTKTVWVDGSAPAITATQLNRIEQGIEDAHAGSVDAGSVATAALADGSVTNGKLRDSVALSVIGRSANSAGDPADIAASTDGHVLRRDGTAIGFGTVATAGIADSAVTNAKVASGQDASKLTTGTLPIARIADGAVTNAKLATGIDAAKITTGALPIARVADGAVTAAKLAAGSGEDAWVRARTAAGVAGAVGTYAFLRRATTGGCATNQELAGADLRYSDTSGTLAGGAPSGTWRCMGIIQVGGAATLFLRTS